MFPLQFRGGALKLFLPMKDYFAANPPEMLLYTNDRTPQYLDETSFFTEATFTGYARQAVTWQTINFDLVQTFGIQSNDVFFNNTSFAAVDVHGFILVDPAEPNVPLIGLRFPGGPVTINAGNRLALQVIWGSSPYL